MTTSQTLVVAGGTPLQRLDIYLSKHIDASRSALQKHIKAGDITVGGKLRKPHDNVHPGDIITINGEGLVVHEQERAVALAEPEVIAEDENYLVVMKPSGLAVHGGAGIKEATLADWAVEHDPVIGDVGDEPRLRPGIVHRLDRDVSGLMVIAKTAEAFYDLKRQFQDHTITKEYLALVYGRMDQEGRINFAITRSPRKNGLMVARAGSTEGKEAETHFHLEKGIKNLSLVRVRTLTGRTHQIRVHFKAVGHPLVGDPLYKMKRLPIVKTPIKRIFLHATKLAFDDLTGERRSYTSPLPADLQAILAKVS